MKKSTGFWLYLILSFLVYGVVQLLISADVLNPFYANTLIYMAINIILAVSLHLVIGITGQFSIGHAGFLAIGAYVSAICTRLNPDYFPLALVAGGVVAALAGLLVGVPSLRLKGDYLAIATLGFGEIIRIVFVNMNAVGGAAGMQVVHLTNWTYTFICLFITLLAIMNFTNSTHGRACIAIRENEIAADAMGINTTCYKVAAFTIGAFFAGIAGGLWAHNFYIIQPTNFGFLKSFDILIFVVLGGLGSMSGAVFAAILMTIVSTYLESYPEARMVIYSIILILVMLYRPGGLMGSKEITAYLGKWTGGKGGSLYGK